MLCTKRIRCIIIIYKCYLVCFLIFTSLLKKNNFLVRILFSTFQLSLDYYQSTFDKMLLKICFFFIKFSESFFSYGLEIEQDIQTLNLLN